MVAASLRRGENGSDASLIRPRSHKRLEKNKADHDSLKEKEQGIDLMITFVSRDGSRHHATEIEHTADDIWRS